MVISYQMLDEFHKTELSEGKEIPFQDERDCQGEMAQREAEVMLLRLTWCKRLCFTLSKFQ